MAQISDRFLLRSNRIRRPSKQPDLARLVEFGRVGAALIHEMSSPLTAASIMLDQVDGAQRDRNLSQVRRNLHTLERYVVAARQQLSGDSQPSSFSLTVAIHQVAMLLSARSKSVNVKLLINSIGSVRLYGNQVKFQQILSNLINNAIEAYEFSHATSRLVNVKVERSGKQKIVLSVTDHGVGIEPKQLKQIFEPFYTTKHKGKRGLGIGLDITKNYVEQDFHGTIEVSSNPEAGTVFKLKIPLAKT